MSVSLSAARVGAHLAIATILMLTACRSMMAPAIEGRSRLTPTAAALAGSEQAPLWQWTAGDHEIDALVPLGPRLLVNAGRLSMYEATSGRILWTADSVPTGAKLMSVVPMLMVAPRGKGAEIFAVDDSTGRVRWRRAVAAEWTWASAGRVPAVYVAERTGKDRFRLTALGVAGGAPVWEREHRWRVMPRLVLTQSGRLLAFGDTLEAISARDGAVGWRLLDVRPVNTLEVAGNLIAFTADGDVVAIDSAGRTPWRVPRSAGHWGPPAFARDDRSLVVGWSDDSSRSRLLSIQLADGSIRWERRPPGAIASLLLLADSQLIFSTAVRDSGTVRFWSAVTGEQLLEAPLPVQSRHMPPDSALRAYGRVNILGRNRLPCPELAAMEANLLPDAIAVYPERVLVVQETAVGALSRRTGQVLWWHRIANPEATFGCVELNRLAADEFARRGEIWGLKGGEGTALESSRLILAQMESVQRQADVLEAQRQARYEGLRSTGRATSFDRDMREAELRSSIDQQRFAAWSEFAVSLINVFTAVAVEYQQQGFGARKALIAQQAAQAPRLHHGALQGDYLVRAFNRGARTGEGDHSWSVCSSINSIFARSCDGFEGRSGILIVDIRTGAWRELTTGPWESGLEQVAMNLQMPRLISGDTLLAVAAIGLDTLRWMGAPRTRGRLVTAPQSVLVYRLAGGRLRPAREYASRETQIRGHPLALSAHLSSIRDSATTDQQLMSWFGAPTTSVADTLQWESLREVHGAMVYERLRCTMRAGVAMHCVSGPPVRR